MPDSIQNDDVQLEALSPRLHAAVTTIVADIPAVARRVTEMIVAAIPDYSEAGDQALVGDLQASVTRNAELWYGCLLDATPLQPEQLAPMQDFARNRVHQGVSLAGLLRAYRVGSRGLWAELLAAGAEDPSLHEELLFKLSPYLLWHFDVVAQTVARAYMDESQQQARWRERLRSELWGVLRHRPEDLDTFRRHADALGLDAFAPHCAVALDLVQLPELPTRREAAIDRLVTMTARSLGLERHALMRVLHQGQLIVWVGVPHGDSPLDTERRLREQAARIAVSSGMVRVAGIGLPGSGPGGWRQSADQALRAIEMGGRLEGTAKVHAYADMALDDAVSGAENVLRYFEAMMEPLAAEPQLLDTLETYFAMRQHRKAVAGALGIHPNTLNYRLERIESLLGAELSSLSWLARLHIAMRLRRRSLPGEGAD